MYPIPFAIANDERINPSNFPATKPKNIPPIPPKNPMIIDSVINKSLISNDFIPSIGASSRNHEKLETRHI